MNVYKYLHLKAFLAGSIEADSNMVDFKANSYHNYFMAHQQAIIQNLAVWKCL